MNIYNNLRQEIESIILRSDELSVDKSKIKLSSISVEPPKNKDHGDVSTNVAMVLSKPLKKNPRELASVIAKEIEQISYVEKVQIAGAGFINLTLSNDIWYETLSNILQLEDNFGNSNIGNGQKVNVEYVSANPTGPMHIGHARGAVYGDALSLLLQKCGFDVTREYYINDAGAQIDVLAKSVFLRYRETLGQEIGKIPAGLYPGEYLVNVGKLLADKYADRLLHMPEHDWLAIVKEFSMSAMMDLVKSDLKLLNIEHDVFTSEKEIQQTGKIEKGLEVLSNKGLIYKGTLEPPKGKQPDDWEPREQTLFKSTSFGDDLDRAVKKADDSYTYFASDIAYHLDKIERGFDKMVIVLGADHGGYIKRLKSIVTALSDGKADIDVKISQIVHFIEDGKPIKMSKRAGTFTTVKDVIEDVGSEIVRFIMLTRKNDAVLDFDLDKVRDQTKDNPVFYVQYANARANSVLRVAERDFPQAFDKYKEFDSSDISLLANLQSEDEIDFIKFMATWPRIVEAAAINNEPHRIAFYLQEIASKFHFLWNKGNSDTTMRFILPENIQLTASRLLMLKAFTYIISSGLSVMGVKPLSEM